MDTTEHSILISVYLQVSSTSTTRKPKKIHKTKIMKSIKADVAKGLEYLKSHQDLDENLSKLQEDMSSSSTTTTTTHSPRTTPKHMDTYDSILEKMESAVRSLKINGDNVVAVASKNVEEQNVNLSTIMLNDDSGDDGGGQTTLTGSGRSTGSNDDEFVVVPDTTFVSDAAAVDELPDLSGVTQINFNDPFQSSVENSFVDYDEPNKNLEGIIDAANEDEIYDWDETTRKNRFNLMQGRDVVTKFLRVIETQHGIGSNCVAGTALNLGEGVVDRYAQDRFRTEAEIAVNRANMLTR